MSSRRTTALALACCLGSAISASAADLTVSNTVIGKTPAYIGFNMGHFLPGSNTAAWVQYSGANGYRVWASASYYEPKDDAGPYGDGVTNFAQFDARKTALRANPFGTDSNGVPYVNWTAFQNNWSNLNQASKGGRNAVVLDPMLDKLKAQNVHVIMEIQRSDSYDISTVGGEWEQWQHYYASAYHLASKYGITDYQMYNEPDLDSIDANVNEYVMRLQLASDAVHAAIDDVNKANHTNLVANMSAPVLAGSTTNFNRYASAILSKRRTDFEGNATSYDIVNSWDAHRYGSTGATNAAVGSAYATEMQMFKQQVPALSPAGANSMLPITYSEFNRYTSSTFAADSTRSLDNPADYSTLASQLLGMTSEDAKALYAFKFNQTNWTVNGSVQPQKTGFYYVDESSATKDTTGATHGAEVMRLFAKGFAGERDRYSTSVPEVDTTSGASSRTYLASSSYDPAMGNYYVFTTNMATSANTGVLDLSAWNVQPGTYVSIEEVSTRRYGEVSQLVQVPANRKLTLTQPGQSVWLATIPQGQAVAPTTINASADAYVENSETSSSARSTNFGAATTGSVGRSSTTLTNDYATYLKFNLGSTQPNGVERAILKVDGHNGVDGDIASFHVYGILNDSWTENGISWITAPDLSSTDSKMLNVGTDAFPVGHLTFDGPQSTAMLDVTDFVRRHPDLVLSFVLVREQTFTGDEDNNRVDLSMRESGDAPQLIVFAPEPASVSAIVIFGALGLTRRSFRKRHS